MEQKENDNALSNYDNSSNGDDKQLKKKDNQNKIIEKLNKPKSESKKCLKDKKTKIILFSIIGVLLIAVIIVVYIKVIGKNKNNNTNTINSNNENDNIDDNNENDNIDDNNENENIDDNNENDNIDDNNEDNNIDDNKDDEEININDEINDDEIVININHKNNDVSIYEDTINKLTNIEINKDIISRRLDTKILNTQIKGEYLLSIYDTKISKNSILYYAYAILLNLKKQLNEKEIFLGGNDIRKSLSDNISFIKFNFDSKGKISDLQVENNYNETLILYIYEFIEKIIPNLNKETYNKRRLNDNSNYSFNKKNDTNGIINIIKNGDYKNIDGSYEEKNININIENNIINQVFTEKKTILNKTDNFESFSEQNFTDETQGNNFATRKSFIQSYTETIKSNLKLNSKNENETLNNQLNEIISKKDLINYNISNRRLLNIKYGNNNNNNNELKLRKNDDIITEPFLQPFIFTYPLFNIDFLGVKISLLSRISFIPFLGNIIFEFFYNKNGNLETITKKVINTNFDEIINAIDDIIIKVRLLIEQNIALELENIYKNISDTINSQLIELFEGIKNPPDLSDIFQEPLKDLFNIVRKSSANCYNNACDNAELFEKQYNDLLNLILTFNQNNIGNIINITENNLLNFLNLHQNDTNDIYEANKIFYPSIKKAIETTLKLNKMMGRYEFNFDITTFYDIQDTHKKIINIFNSFKERIENAISNDNFTFYNKINEQFDKILNDPLKNVEIISYNAKNNASVIDSMKIFWDFISENEGDIRREKLISRINTLRTNITNIISIILGQINDVYNDKIFNSESFKKIIDNLNEYSKEIENNYTSLMDYLKDYVHFDKNF